MMLFDNDPKTSQPKAVWGSSPMTLAEIYRPDITLAILERELEQEVSDYAKFALAQSDAISFVQMLGVEEVKKTLRGHLPPHQYLEKFLDDVEIAASMFGLLFATDEVGLRLQDSTKSPCPAFHCDRIPCRLLLTYHGIGTQWLDENNVDRTALGAFAGRNRIDRNPAGRTACLDASRINAIGTGHIAIFKGEGWEGNEGKGLVHRSPPVTADCRRLLLTIDLG